MNNACLSCLTATAGTWVGQDLEAYYVIIKIYSELFALMPYILHIGTENDFDFSFLQVAGSAVRLLTNIPHCCK